MTIPLDAIKYSQSNAQTATIIENTGCAVMPVLYNPDLDHNQNGMYEPAELTRSKDKLDLMYQYGTWGQSPYADYFSEWIRLGHLPPVCEDEEKYHGENNVIDNLRDTEDINVFWRFYRSIVDWCGQVQPSSHHGIWGLPTQKQCTDQAYRTRHPLDGYLACIPENGKVHINCYIGMDPNTNQPNYPWVRQVIEGAWQALIEAERTDIGIIAWLQPLVLGMPADYPLMNNDHWQNYVSAALDPAMSRQVDGLACWMSYRPEWRQALWAHLTIMAAACRAA